MNFNRISIGGGLAVLGGSIFALAGAMVFLSASHAAQADLTRSAVPGPGIEGGRGIGSYARGRIGRDGATEPHVPSMAPMGGTDGCVTGATLDWFSEVRELPACFSDDMHDDEDAEDWNRDGTTEFVRTSFNVPILLNGQPQPPTCLAVLTTTQWNGTTVIMTERCIEDSMSLRDFALGRFPGQSIRTGSSGWRDLDGDGDLDFVVSLLAGTDWNPALWVWLENTGFEATQPLVGDLNRDGAVNPADLAMLLGGWTG